MLQWKKGPRRQERIKTQRARELRKRMTDAERQLWRLLRNRSLQGLKFRRQVPFGPFYLDFYCAEGNIAIELDGGQHCESIEKARDARRDAYLRSKGLYVFRYSDRDLLIDSKRVLEDLLKFVNQGKFHPLHAAGKGLSPPQTDFQGERKRAMKMGGS